jgi:hypothetical protein
MTNQSRIKRKSIKPKLNLDDIGQKKTCNIVHKERTKIDDAKKQSDNTEPDQNNQIIHDT